MKRLVKILSVMLIFLTTADIYGFDITLQVHKLTAKTFITKGESKTVKLKIKGMTCGGCASHVTKALEAVKGISNVDLEYPGDVAKVEFDPTLTNTDKLISAVKKINYNAEEVKDTKVTPSIK